ncbi:MAG TPA: riboflavin synthase [Thermoanaerobaculia bacterium]|jgi:riboflavin synthase alpha subunit|nr:riboflavin synthase [Thermoanaerobaculia bacterium]
MFTGIVTGVGRVKALERRRGRAVRLTVDPPARYGRFRRGESVAVSGVCVTAIESGRRLVADLSAETLRVTTLSELAPGDPVNLERALEWRGSVSGHFVLGHVDAVSRLLAVGDSTGSWTYRFSIPRGLGRFVVRKGSVALDGVSLTVAARRPRDFDVAVIPETRRRTSLASKRPGDPVNFEIDLLARYGRIPRVRRG